jgi:hypothetical protein
MTPLPLPAAAGSGPCTCHADAPLLDGRPDPPPELIDNVNGLIDRLPRADLAVLRQALAAGLADDLAEVIDEKLATHHSPLTTHEGIDVKFARYWNRCRIQMRAAECRKLFDALPWHDPDFERDFWEGLDRAELSERWKAGKVEPYWWLRQSGWTDRFFDAEGKPIRGVAERRREAAQAQALSAVIRQAGVDARGVFKPVPAAEPTLAEWYSTHRAGGGAACPDLEAYLAAGSPGGDLTENYLKRRAGGGDIDPYNEPRLRQMLRQHAPRKDHA